jgi:uncharacterized protein (TIGR00369 family)
LKELQRLAHEAAPGGLPQFLGIELVHIEAGRATGRIDVGKELLSSFGNLHGGVTAALVDHVLGAAVLGLVEAGHWPATLEFKLNYLASIQNGLLEATAEVVASTRRTAVVRVDVTNRDRLVAVGQGTVMIVAPRPPSGDTAAPA